MLVGPQQYKRSWILLWVMCASVGRYQICSREIPCSAAKIEYTYTGLFSFSCTLFLEFEPHRIHYVIITLLLINTYSYDREICRKLCFFYSWKFSYCSISVDRKKIINLSRASFCGLRVFLSLFAFKYEAFLIKYKKAWQISLTFLIIFNFSLFSSKIS